MTASESSYHPLTLKKRGDDHLVIQWSDGHESMYAWEHLRSNCPCAGCREERELPPDPFRILKPSEVPKGPMRATAVTPMGHYAYKITWNDGHDTGIYTLEALRELCQCRECQNPKPEVPDSPQ